MSGIIKVTIVTFVIIVLFAAGFTMAAKPAYTGLKYPQAVGGQTGSVTGRVTTSATGTVGMAGAYIAIVNASNFSEEYVNTTSDANGFYQFVGVNATYNHSNASDVGPNGPTPYVIYANRTPYGEGYSAAFGVDGYDDPSTSSTNLSPVTVASTPAPTAVASPVASPASSPAPTPTLTPTSTPTAMPPSSTPPAPTVTPRQTPDPLSMIFPLLVVGFVVLGVMSKGKKN